MNPHDIASEFLEKLAPHEPAAAQALGRNADDRLPDFSPEWCAERYRVEGETVNRLQSLPQADLSRTDLALVLAMVERLESDRRLYETGFLPRLIAPLASPAQFIREAFDGVTIGPGNAEAVVTRLESVPKALYELERRLLWAKERGEAGDFTGSGIVARRQIDVLADQIDLWLDPNGMDFFNRIPIASDLDNDLVLRTQEAGHEATIAFHKFRRMLIDTLRPAAPEHDAVGEATYLATARSFLGTNVDLNELTDYGWAELHRLTAKAREVAAGIAGVPADARATRRAASLLDAGNSPFAAVATSAAVTTEREIAQWLDTRLKETIKALDGVAFDMPENVYDVECDVTRATSGVVYYTPGAPDGSRPGRVVWTIPRDAERLSVWQEVTGVHHEGVPGHHLEHSINRANETLHPWQRYLCEVHGYAEGWAHYSEQLSEELGLLRDDGEVLGMLLGQIWRAVRVVADIGLHTGRLIPDNPFTRAREWTPAVAEQLLVELAHVTPQTARFEVDRYYAWPGQALAFKAGQKLWNELRARAEVSDHFELKRFHSEALAWGPMGLEPLAQLLNEGATA